MNMKIKNIGIKMKNVVKKEPIFTGLSLVALIALVASGKGYADSLAGNEIISEDTALNFALIDNNNNKDDIDLNFIKLSKNKKKYTISYQVKDKEVEGRSQDCYYKISAKDGKILEKDNTYSYENVEKEIEKAEPREIAVRPLDEAKEAALQEFNRKPKIQGITVDYKLLEIHLQDSIDSEKYEYEGIVYPTKEYVFIFKTYNDVNFNGEDTASVVHIDSETLEVTTSIDCPYECRRQTLASGSQKLFEDYDDTKDVFNSKDIK